MENAQHSAIPVTQKRSNIASNISSIILGLSLLLLLVTILMIASGHKDRNFLGVRFFSVLSDSMKPTFQAGDLVVGRSVDVSTLEKGDIITFKSSDPLSFNHLITHQVIKVIDKDGTLSFKTKGINVAQADDVPAAADRVISKYNFSIPKAGYLFDFFQTTTGYVVLFLLPFACIIFFQIRKIIRYSRVIKEEQLQAIELQFEKRQLDQGKMTDMIDQITALQAKLHQYEDAPQLTAPVSTQGKAADDELLSTPVNDHQSNSAILNEGEARLVAENNQNLLENTIPPASTTKFRLLDNGKLVAPSLDEDSVDSITMAASEQTSELLQGEEILTNSTEHKLGDDQKPATAKPNHISPMSASEHLTTTSEEQLLSDQQQNPSDQDNKPLEG